MNKIVLAQINTIAGNLEYNSNKIIESIKKAKEQNAELIIFPEYALIGYPFGDIFKRHTSIIKRQFQALEKIISQTDNITVLLGFVEQEQLSGKTNKFNDAVAVIQNGKQTGIIRKNDEIKIFELNGEKCAVLIGENYNFDFLKTQKPDTVINCTCSPTRTGKEYLKNTLLKIIAKTYKVNYIFVNQAGYGDNHCYDGTSRIYNKNGELTLRAKAFEEDFALADNMKGIINKLPEGMSEKIDFDNFTPDYKSDLERTYKAVIMGIREYFAKNGFKKAVLGLSGGLDSTICAVLLADALGKENVWGISMPSRITTDTSKNDAKILAENLGIHFFEIPLAKALDTFKEIFNYAFEQVKTDRYENSTTIENLQARTRATILWSISNEHKQMLPIATSDKSEAYIGYATVNGDMSGGFAPIADVTKTKLFALGHFLNEYREQKNVIPKSILEKAPGAELKINPKTGKPVCAEEDNMPYEFLDEIIWHVENSGFGYDELINHNFYYEKNNHVAKETKEEWINKFFWKSKCAVYKWHIMPASVIVDSQSINSVEYHQPIISKIN